MSPTPTNEKQEIYIFRGKEILTDAWTVSRLNYALALNRQSERYVLKPDKNEKPVKP